jgi:hypothetical protein
MRCISAVRLRVPSPNNRSRSPAARRASAASIDCRAARATSRAVNTASSDDTSALCGTLIVPKHRLEKRRRRSLKILGPASAVSRLATAAPQVRWSSTSITLASA